MIFEKRRHDQIAIVIGGGGGIGLEVAARLASAEASFSTGAIPDISGDRSIH